MVEKIIGRLVTYEAKEKKRRYAGYIHESHIELDLMLMLPNGNMSRTPVELKPVAYWADYLEPRIRGYHGNVLIERGLGRPSAEYQVHLLDLTAEERDPLFPYKNFEDRVKKLEEQVADLRRQHALFNSEGFDMTRNYGSSDDPK